MFSRRLFLRSLAGTVVARSLHAGLEISQRPEVFCRRYTVTATVTLLSVALVSRSGVGGCYITIEDAQPRTTAIQFAAGSWPEKARGLNRLGYIKEIVTEKTSGRPASCDYFAFMTSSQEKNLDQAKRAVSTPENGAAQEIPYAAAEGAGREGRFRSKLAHLSLSSAFQWRDLDRLMARLPADFAAAENPEIAERGLPEGENAPATFLYAVRRAILDPAPESQGMLVYNGKQYQLHTRKQREYAAGSRMIRLDATLLNDITGHTTPFAVWFEEGSERRPPLRFEYQARSFLRLTFAANPAAEFSSDAQSAVVPPISLVLSQKEDS
jgi:hypothetical protein